MLSDARGMYTVRGRLVEIGDAGPWAIDAGGLRLQGSESDTDSRRGAAGYPVGTQMALQSQTLRGSSNIRSSGSPARQGRSGQKRLVGLALLVLILGGGFMYLVRNRDGGGGTGILGPQAAKGASADGVTLPVPGTGAQGALGPTSNPAGTQGAPKPEPMVLQMGSKQRPGGAGAGVNSPTSTLPAFTAATKPTASTNDMSGPASAPAAAGGMGTSDQSTPLRRESARGSPRQRPASGSVRG